MCEEESPHGIVGVGVSFRVFMVNTVVACPMVNTALVSNGVTEHKKETDREGCGVGTMLPKTVHSHCYSKAAVIFLFRIGGRDI